jgi:hypothetical protein
MSRVINKQEGKLLYKSNICSYRNITVTAMTEYDEDK